MMFSVICGLMEGHYVELLALVMSVIGGCIGLRQWKKSNDYKRADMAKELIAKIIDDKEIAFVMDSIDWGEEFIYNGKFRFKKDKEKEQCKSEQDLFIAIDRTLTHFNYICYLYSLKAFKKEDMVIFEYAIRRLFDNIHVRNYLYSLNCWSTNLDVSCSYKHLISYGIKRNYISKDFLKENANQYKCYLRV